MNTVYGVVVWIDRYQANVMPDPGPGAPESIRDGVWIPARDLKVGDRVSLKYQRSASMALWTATRVDG
jgi:hypothetical protein